MTILKRLAIVGTLLLVSSSAQAQGNIGAQGYYKSGGGLGSGGAFTGPLLGPDGGCPTSPTYAFTNEPDTGWYHVGAGASSTIRACVNGTNVASFGSSSDFYLPGAGAAIIMASNVFYVAEASGHAMQRNSGAAQRQSWTNDYTSATNYSSLSADWQTAANQMMFGTRTAATGTTRLFRLVAQEANAGANGPYLHLTRTGGPLIQAGYGVIATSATANYALTEPVVSLGHGTNTLSSGNGAGVVVETTTNQTSTAGFTDLKVNRTDTASGSGPQYLFEAQRGTTLQFAIRTGRAGVGLQIRTAQATVPTCATNCGTSPTIVGTDTAMRVTMGATGTPASGWIITFNGTWASAPACSVTPGLAGMVVGKLPIVVATTTTTLTVTTNGTAPANNDIYNIICIGVT